MRRISIFISALLLGFLLVACNTETSTTTTITTIEKQISVDDTDIDLSIQSEYVITYQLNFDLQEAEVISFTSSNPDVATVSMLGKVTGVGYGECQITLRYDESTTATVNINISSTYQITPPEKTVYSVDENLNLRGAKLSILDEEGLVVETVNITDDMLLDYNETSTGSQMIQFQYQDVIYGFEIYRLNQKQETSKFDDFIYLNQTLTQGDKIEFALMKSNTDDFLDAIDNVYDYNEINIYALIQAPSGETKHISAFWYQDYTERLTDITVNPNLRLEGTVNDLNDDYDVLLQYETNGEPQYRMRYMPKESGTYQATLVVEVDGVVIQTIDKSFIVGPQYNSDYKGFIQVDTSNNRHFIFDDGETYIAVGQNVAWYTSVERKYYDYKHWFEEMNQVGMNYARVWMSAWGYSIFWDDLYQYDGRQTNMYSLDQTLNLADDNDIYIQLCLLHHGMFSQVVNPMWKNSESTWYTSRYGVNPYSQVIDNSGLFFADGDVKDIFKNQLTYIIARYGYSDNIMSWELFNEVDWIETYTPVAGNLWHEEMAEFIESIDPNNHMITTSLNNQSFLSSNYQVFDLDSIDFVNVHHYGIYNHTAVLPGKQNIVYELFDKPVIYDEVGYSGWGGQDQHETDPNNVTLHQELWAGALGGGGGTGMNWWWESWIDPYDAYGAFEGIATYSTYMDLNGTNYQFVTSGDPDYDDVTISGTQSGYMGYLVDNRAYLYIFDKTYTLDNQNPAVKTGVTVSLDQLETGSYQYLVFDTFTGEIVATNTINVTQNQVTLTLPDYTRDTAIIFALQE